MQSKHIVRKRECRIRRSLSVYRACGSKHIVRRKPHIAVRAAARRDMSLSGRDMPDGAICRYAARYRPISRKNSCASAQVKGLSEIMR